MIAVLVVRDGVLPHGADAVIDECAGRVVLIGDDVATAAGELRAQVHDLVTCEAGPFAPSAWSTFLAPVLSDETVVLASSPDGRDLAGRLAGALGRPCHAWCTEVTSTHVVMTRHDGAQSVTVRTPAPVVATLLSGRREPREHAAHDSTPTSLVYEAPTGSRDAEVLAVEQAAPGELELADASRVVAGGVGLGGAAEFAMLASVAESLDASMGATRPIADRGLVSHSRQIGTTGEAIDPSLYVAFGISGAIQHTAGLGSPEHVIAVNVDASCPMMALAHLAIVADAPATVAALAARLRTPS